MAAMNRRLDAKTDRTNDPLEMSMGLTASTAFSLFRSEDLSNSEDIMVKEFFGKRDRAIDQMIDDGEIPAAVVNETRREVGMNSINGMPYYENDYHALAKWSNENTDSEFDDDDEKFKDYTRVLREDRQRLLTNGSLVGELAGNMGAAMTDPVLLSTIVATVPSSIPAAGASFATTVARSALVEGLIGMAVEAPLQVRVAEYKHRIDSPYTFEDAIQNILIAGGAGAVLSGGGAAVKYWLNTKTADFTDAAGVDASPETKRIADELKELDESPDDHGVETVGDHLDRTLNAEKVAKNPKPAEAVEVEERVDGQEWEPDAPEDWDMEIQMEDGSVRTLRDINEQYEREMVEDEAALDEMVACTLLPSGVSGG
jgi:hypothetical protein